MGINSISQALWRIGGTMREDLDDQPDRSSYGPMVGDGGQGVAVYALVVVTFVAVLVLVLTSLGDSIGLGINDLVDTISQPFGG
mgnify:CR=1 FL=1